MNTDQAPETTTRRRSAHWIAVGLLAGIGVGLLFGEYCQGLQSLGDAYVGLLQMTVLPYLSVSLVAKLGRLNLRQAGQIGRAALLTLPIMWLTGILFVVLVSFVLPPTTGASFFQPPGELAPNTASSFLSQFVPSNVYRALTNEVVPAVVVFCLFFGTALITLPNKTPLLELLDACADALSQINVFLVRLAPLGLFALTAAAAGTLRLGDLSRLQAYLLMYSLACVLIAFGVLPLLVSSLTETGYREFLRAAEEPLLTALATGKLFVVLPQIIDQTEKLISPSKDTRGTRTFSDSSANVIIPLAYPFPHIGKIITFVFISFAAWYTGRELEITETSAMAASGAVSSFASPLISIPYLLDSYQIPNDLIALFILPGFITMRLGDLVGVTHLMALALIVTQLIEGGLRVRWKRLILSSAGLAIATVALIAISRVYLANTTLEYRLDEQLMALTIPDAYEQVEVLTQRPPADQAEGKVDSTLARIQRTGTLRVGYPSDHLPYSYRNAAGQLVGMDIELMHRLARDLNTKLLFVPIAFPTVASQLESGEIDIAVGGLMVTTDRLLRVDFTQGYSDATIAMLVKDHRRHEFRTWADIKADPSIRVAVSQPDLKDTLQRLAPNHEIIALSNVQEFFSQGENRADALIIAGEEAAAWTILHPEFNVVIPQPVRHLSVAMAIRAGDVRWKSVLDRWLEMERSGAAGELKSYWIEGGGTQHEEPRWSILRDVLGWLP